MKPILILLFISILHNKIETTQIENEDTSISISAIKFAPENDSQAYPILNMNDGLSLQLSFDILGKEAPTVSYRIIHCNKKWEPSSLNTSQYLSSNFNDFYINNYEYSFNTQTSYTHYTVQIPNEEFQINLSGNYTIEIYYEDTPEKILFSRKFFVSENTIDIIGNTTDDYNIQFLKSNQIIEFSVIDKNETIIPPQNNITAIISQNFRWDTQHSRTVKPLFLSKNKLQFKYKNRKLSFKGGYEFPYFNIIDLYQTNNTVHSIEKDENNLTHCYLNPDRYANKNYFRVKDINGNFFHKAYNRESVELEGEYSFVHFSFVSPKLPYDVFVCGYFNNWQTDKTNRMQYDEEYGFYHTSLFLKQGIYNYTYVGKNENGDIFNLLGDFKETENDYYIFIYNKDESLQTDKLIGWKRLNSIDDRK